MNNKAKEEIRERFEEAMEGDGDDYFSYLIGELAFFIECSSNRAVAYGVIITALQELESAFQNEVH